MTTTPSLRTPTDEDFDSYSAYVSQLASSPASGRPSITPFRIWFFWRHNAFPATELIHDQTDPQAAA